MEMSIRHTWRDAFGIKALALSASAKAHENATVGFRIVWVLWSADVWFSGVLPFPVPLLKSMVLCNVIVWIILFMR